MPFAKNMCCACLLSHQHLHEPHPWEEETMAELRIFLPTLALYLSLLYGCALSVIEVIRQGLWN